MIAGSDIASFFRTRRELLTLGTNDFVPSQNKGKQNIENE